MARKDALVRLHQRLAAKRDALRKKLVDEFDLCRTSSTGVGDVGDAASDGAQNEIDSQLASLESRELAQIERAIELIREGSYGICEICERQIPIERLKVLPFAPTCVDCQRKREEFRDNPDDLDANWETAYEFEGRMDEKELTLGDLDVDT